MQIVSTIAALVEHPLRESHLIAFTNVLALVIANGTSLVQTIVVLTHAEEPVASELTAQLLHMSLDATVLLTPKATPLLNVDSK